MDGTVEYREGDVLQPTLEYEARTNPWFDPESVRLTRVAGGFTLAAWGYALAWAAWPVAFRHNVWSLIVLCLLPLVGSGYFVGAVLQPPTWWYTRLVGTLLGLLWLMLGITGLVELVRLATSTNLLIVGP